MASGEISERPDKLYYDEISRYDVEDLRHKVTLSGTDYSKLLEENLNLLWKKQLPSELKNSTLDTYLAGNKILQVDGISNVTRSGINDQERNPDSFRRVFMESKGIQKISIYIDSVNQSGGKIWFTNIGNNNGDYELFNENLCFSSKKDPIVVVFDELLKTRSVLAGGTWHGLGEYRITATLGVPNRISYTPTKLSLIEGKKAVFVFDFVMREGGGIGQAAGGFSYSIDNMLKSYNQLDGKPVECVNYEEDFIPVELTNPRVTGTFIDTALSRSIRRFEDALKPANFFPDMYKGACVELIYYKVSNGEVEDLILFNLPETGTRTVVGIYSIFNMDLGSYLSPSIEITNTGFKVSGLTVNLGDVLQYTLLLGDYTMDFIPHTRGIQNIARTYSFSVGINVAQTEVILNAKGINTKCDGLVASCGFYNGVEKKFVAYITTPPDGNPKMVTLSSIEGLGTPLLKCTLSTGSPYTGQIVFKLLGYYNPIETDKFYFEYLHTPYKGILQTRLSSGETQRVKILKVDEKIAVTSAGCGNIEQEVPKDMLNLIENLPITNKTLDYNFFGENLPSPLSGGISALRRIPGRGITSNSTHTYLKEGDILGLTLGNSAVPVLRGGIIDLPKIHENGLDFNPPAPIDPPTNTPSPSDPNYDPRLDPTTLTYNPFYDPTTSFNHVTQWTAVVEGLDDLRGELFLMVVTTAETVYNLEEGPTYSYLELKGIYKDNALGKASETVLDNSLTGSDLTTNLGGKIYGAVDLFPLKYRPLINPSSDIPAI